MDLTSLETPRAGVLYILCMRDGRLGRVPYDESLGNKIRNPTMTTRSLNGSPGRSKRILLTGDRGHRPFRYGGIKWIPRTVSATSTDETQATDHKTANA